ncbi:MAG: transcription elongation factor GreA [bacterium]
MEPVYLTREGLEKVRQELEHLLKVVRPEVTAQLVSARELGDLSENAEYHAAKERLARIDRQIAELQSKLNFVRLVDQNELAGDEVRIFSRVTLLNIATNHQQTYTLVDPLQASPAQGLISVRSPIGEALLGHKVGDEIEIKVPSGILRLRVIAIERAQGI